MKKKVSALQKTETLLSRIFLVFIFSVISFLAVKKTLHDFVTIKKNDYKIGIVQKIEKKEKNNYLVDIAYEKNGELINGNFYAKKNLSDIISDYFDTKYRVGNKIPILVRNNKNIIAYSDRNYIIIKDIIFSTAGIAFLLIFTIFIFKQNIYQADETEYDKKESICSALNTIAYI